MVRAMRVVGVRRRRGKWGLGFLETGVLVLATGLAGCQPRARSPKVIFLDGAGHFGAGMSVRRGLEQAGYIGSFETFSWSSWLGPGADHLVVARSKGKAGQLVAKIVESRRALPEGKIYVMGLSAGTALILSALEALPGDACVDAVVLFSPSVSANRNLSKALRHVKGRLYATCSPHDGILSALSVNADGGSGPPAGLGGFRLPIRLRREEMAEYQKVVNIPWQGSYAGFGWHGGHVQVTTSGFLQHVVAPRMLSVEAYPLDRGMVGGGLSGPGRSGEVRPASGASAWPGALGAPSLVAR